MAKPVDSGHLVGEIRPARSDAPTSLAAAGGADERAVLEDSADLETTRVPEVSHRRQRRDRRRGGHTADVDVRCLRCEMGRPPDAEDPR